MSNTRESDETRKNLVISRRQLVSTAAAIGLVASVPAGVGGKAYGQEARSGGRLRMAVSGGTTTDTLDPGTWNDIYMQAVGFGTLRNNLAEISANNVVVPELAESWEPSPDAKTWTFRLRKGVEFHSGKTLSAADVLATMNHHRGPNTTSVAKGLTANIDDIRIDDQYIITFVLKQGNADFPAILTDYHLGIMPSTPDGGIDWRSGDGTGGYSLVTFQPGVRALLKRFPKYWKTGFAHFDEVEVICINDVAARQNALITGAVDVADRIDLKTIDLLKRNPNIVIENVPGKLYYTFEMLTTVAPFSDPNLRLAAKHAIDREALLNTVLRGYGSLGNDQPISGAYRYFDSTIPQRKYDPEQARFYIKKADLATFTVNLNFSDFAFNGASDASVLFKEQAAKAGLLINLIREPSDGYVQRTQGKVPFMANYLTGRPTEDGILSVAFTKNAALNNGKWDSPEVDALIRAARSELDDAKRREMYSEIQKRVRDEGASLIPLFANYVFARSSKLAHGPALSSDRSLDGAKMAERWWFA